jgi:hypothetical protein
MKDLFMCLLLNLTKHGKLTEANMYRGGDYSSITVESEDAIYTVTIRKEEKQNED